MAIKMIIFVLLTSLLLLSCQDMPSRPEYSNPLDSENPQTHGDPFQLEASIAEGGILLKWNALTLTEIAGYRIYRSETGEENFSSIAATEKISTAWVDTSIANGESYWYKVAAFDDQSHESSISPIVPVRINTNPVLVVNGGDEFTSTREVELTIIASTASEIKISNNNNLNAISWQPAASKLTWTLPTGTGEKTVYLQVKYSDETESTPVFDLITPQPMNPDFQLAGGAESTTSRQVPVNCDLEGKNLQMKISESISFNDAQWQPFQSNFMFELSEGDNLKTVYMIFKNDFEIESSIISRQITPKALDQVVFTINSNDKYAASQEVTLQISPENAESCKVSEDSTFQGLNWQNFSNSMPFTLSAGEGEKKVYLILRNDFGLTSDIFSAEIILDLTAPQAVFELNPESGITDETQFDFDARGVQDNLSPASDLQLRWDWENDSNFDVDWTTFKLISHVFNSGGAKTVVLEVKDGAGWTNRFSQPIDINSRPVARFSVSPQLGEPGTEFTFDASQSNDPDGETLQYRWDLESDSIWDTNWSTTATHKHQFSEGGNYNVTLEITDSHNLTASASQLVVVIVEAEMVLVPSGAFLMGTETGIGDLDEEPVHEVRIDDFYIDKYEVTNFQYSQFLSLGNDQHFRSGMKIILRNDGIFVPESGSENHPVVFVTYEDALAYARWQEKSLPTEAQWEKAARSETARIYPWGNGIEPNNANYWRNGDPFENGNYPLTTPVGFFNGQNYNGYQTRGSHGPYLNYDMAGNVAEWCLDWYSADYYEVSSSENPTGPGSGTSRVVRGGSWSDEPYYLRTAARSHFLPIQGSAMIGFRCVR